MACTSERACSYLASSRISSRIVGTSGGCSAGLVGVFSLLRKSNVCLGWSKGTDLLRWRAGLWRHLRKPLERLMIAMADY